MDGKQQLWKENYKFRGGVIAQKLWRRHKFFRPATLERSDYIKAKPFNYYESPYPDIIEIHKREKELFDKNREVLEVDFNVGRQFELMKEMENISLPEWSIEKGKGDYRYYYHNKWFGKGSADALYYMIRILKPENIIEVGSGFSTAVMLDTNENYFNNEINIKSVEPRAERLKSLLKTADNIKIYEKDLQEIPLQFFDILGENDILFIDSSHVSKMNSDVNYIFFEILPRLKKNVYIHFHDIYYPFIYSKECVYEGRAYNEMYILRAFLMGNGQYSVQFFGDMLQQKYSDKMSERMQGCGTGSIWIKKC